MPQENAAKLSISRAKDENNKSCLRNFAKDLGICCKNKKKLNGLRSIITSCEKAK